MRPSALTALAAIALMAGSRYSPDGGRAKREPMPPTTAAARAEMERDAMTFEEAWLEAQNVGTLLGQERGRVLWDALQQRAMVPGDVVELGVYKGGSALLLHRAAPSRQLHLFDTFTGHPDVDRQYDDRAAQPVGRFADTSANAVSALFTGAPVAIHVGVFPASAAYWHPAPQIVVAHVDADLYECRAAS